MYRFYGRVGLYIYIGTHRGIGFHALQSSRRVIFSRKTGEISLSVLLDLSGKQTTAEPWTCRSPVFFHIPLSISFSLTLSLTISLSLSDFGRVGSSTEKRLTADDGQAAIVQSVVTTVGGARRAGPAGAYSRTEALTRIYVCVLIH